MSDRILRNHFHHISFLHAWEGIRIAVLTQPNFRVLISLSLLALFLGYRLQITPQEWALILFVIATGLAIELLNTSIEYTVDLMTDEYHLLAKFAKDTAAGAMLVYAVFSVVIAAVIFLPKLQI
jgi:undecaprenol kinase